MEILQWSGLFVISLAVLIKAAEYFTQSAENIGLHYKIPPFIVGVTIIAMGTSLPEIATSIIAVLQNHPEIVIGNVVGSNMANILLVLGISAIVGKHLIVDKEISNIDLPILLGSTIFLFITTIDGKFGYIDGILALLILLTYILYNIKSHRKVDIAEAKKIAEKIDGPKREHLHIKYPLILVASSIFLYFSADWVIKSVVGLSQIFQIGTEIIALSAIAVGTSLPELAVSLMAIKKGKTDIAIGNVTGSNIFNALAVMGIPAFFGTLSIPPDFISFTIPVLLLVTILYMFVTMDKQVTQWEGITLLLIFIAFMGKTFGVI